MLVIPYDPSLNFRVSNMDGVRPAQAYGATVQSHANTYTYGSYVQLISGASVTYDCYWVELILSGVSSAAALRRGLITLGLDPAGGTSYTDVVLHLNCSMASLVNGTGTSGDSLAGCGYHYIFPLYIKSGTSVAAKHANQLATINSYVTCRLYGGPSSPELWRRATITETIGATYTAGSSIGGVSVTTGTSVDGSWVSLGTTTNDLWYWMVSSMWNDSTLNGVCYHLDLAAGNGTSYRILIEDLLVSTSANEAISCNNVKPAYGLVKAGETLYARAQCSGTGDTALSIIAYGFGG